MNEDTVIPDLPFHLFHPKEQLVRKPVRHSFKQRSQVLEFAVAEIGFQHLVKQFNPLTLIARLRYADIIIIYYDCQTGIVCILGPVHPVYRRIACLCKCHPDILDPAAQLPFGVASAAHRIIHRPEYERHFSPVTALHLSEHR